MLKKNRKSKFKKLALILFIILGLTIGAVSVAARVEDPTHDTVVDPGIDPGVIDPGIVGATGNAWATISIVVMTLAIGCIVVTGLRYMLSSSDRKADIKQSSAYIVIGCILIFATMPIINIVTNTFKETVGAHIVYDSTNDSYKGNGSIEKATITSTTVGRNHFQNAASLKTVVFEEGVEFIQGGAFKNCKNLEEIILPSTIKSIGPSAFEGCVNAKRIIIRSKDKDEAKTLDGVKYNVVGVIVGEKAFKGCEKAAKFGVGKHIYFASIGDSAFDGCKKLQGFYKLNATNDLEITADNEVLRFSGEPAAPGSNDIVSKIGLNAFNKTDLSILKVSTVNSFGERNNAAGSLETIKNKTLLQINKVMDDKDITEISVENHSKIEFLNESFKDFKKLTKINIGTDCDINFGISAFENCSALQTVEIGDRAKPVTFGEKSFKSAGNYTMTVTLGGGTGADTITFGKEAFALANMSALDIGESYKVNIGESAFAGSGVVTVGIGINSKGVTFGKTSFSGCSKLGELVIGENASNVTFDEGSFAGAGTGGFTVTVNSALVSGEGANKHIDIRKNAFTGAFIQNLAIKDNYTVSVGNLAFAGTGIQTVEIGDNSSTIRFGESAFDSCVSLNTLAIGDNILDNVTFGINSFKNAGTDLNVTIGESSAEKAEDTIVFMGSAFEVSGVLDFTVGKSHRVSIGDNAFNSANSLEKFVVPITINDETKAEDYSIVSKIGANAFMGCTALQEFGTLKNTQTAAYLDLDEISNSAFNACGNLKTIRIYSPEKIINIGDMAFYGCSNMNGAILPAYNNTRLGNIGASAFEKGIFDGDLVLYGNSIGKKAFLETGVSSVEFMAGEVRCSIGSQAFEKTPIKTLIPSAGMWFDIGTKAFFECTELNEGDEPNKLEMIFERIGQAAFKGCSNLVNVTLASSGNVNGTIFYEAFANSFINDSSESSLTLTGNITISDRAFASAYMDTAKFTFEGESNIANAAFQNCANLNQVDIIKNSDKATLNIGEYAFANSFSTSGGTLNLTGNINLSNNAAQKANVSTLNITATGQNTIGSNVFLGCANLNSATIETEGTKASLNIGSNAFSGAYADNATSENSLTLTGNINISEGACKQSAYTENHKSVYVGPANLKKLEFTVTGVNSIGSQAFLSCSKLENVTIKTDGPKASLNIGSNAFSGAYADNATSENSLTLTGNINIADYAFTKDKLNLHNSDGRFKSTEVPFARLKTISFSTSGISSIGKMAFLGCPNLKNVTLIADGQNAAMTIGQNAFSGAVTGTLSLTGNIAVNNNAFSAATRELTDGSVAVGASNLTKIIASLKGSIDKIGDEAFKGCKKLISVDISGKVPIGANAFNGAFDAKRTDTTLKLSSIDIAAKGVFEDAQFKSLIINELGSDIGERAFADTSVKTVTIHGSVNGKSIGKEAFANCPLESFEFDKDVVYIPDIGERAFASAGSNNFVIDKIRCDTISQSAFEGCKFKQINITANSSKGLKIQMYAFKNATGYKSNNIFYGGHINLYQGNSGGTITINGNAFYNDIDDKNGKLDTVNVYFNDINLYMNSFANTNLNFVRLEGKGNVTIQNNAFLNSTVGNLTIDAGTIDIKSGFSNSATINYMSLDSNGNIIITEKTFLNSDVGNLIIDPGIIDIESDQITPGTIEINANGFSNLTKIDKVNFKNAYVKMEANSFEEANINYIVIGENVTFSRLNANTFLNCALKGFINESGNHTYIRCDNIAAGAFTGAKNLEKLYVTSTYNGNKIYIGNTGENSNSNYTSSAWSTIFGKSSDSSYANNNNITEVKFKGNVIVGRGAFAFSDNLKYVGFETENKSITEVNVYDNAFYACQNLTKIGLEDYRGLYFKNIGVNSFRDKEGGNMTSLKGFFTLNSNGGYGDIVAPVYMDSDSKIGSQAFLNTSINSIHLIARKANSNIIIEDAFSGPISKITFERYGNTSVSGDNKTFIVNKGAFNTRGNVNITIKDGVYVGFEAGGAVSGNDTGDLKIDCQGSGNMTHNRGSGNTTASFRYWKNVYRRFWPSETEYKKLEGSWR